MLGLLLLGITFHAIGLLYVTLRKLDITRVLWQHEQKIKRGIQEDLGYHAPHRESTETMSYIFLGVFELSGFFFDGLYGIVQSNDSWWYGLFLDLPSLLLTTWICWNMQVFSDKNSQGEYLDIMFKKSPGLVTLWSAMFWPYVALAVILGLKFPVSNYLLLIMETFYPMIVLFLTIFTFERLRQPPIQSNR